MRFDDYSRATRSHTMPEPTSQTGRLLATAVALLKAAMPTIERRGLTLIGVALANLGDDAPIQLMLPLDRAQDLDLTLDEVRTRFGSAAIMRGVLIGRDPGPWVPLLPD
jgi:DNA polymerase-4